MWDIAVVKFWPLLPRLLSILAVVSLLIVPMAAPSVVMAAAPAGAMEDMASMADGTPCPLRLRQCGAERAGARVDHRIPLLLGARRKRQCQRAGEEGAAGSHPQR